MNNCTIINTTCTILPRNISCNKMDYKSYVNVDDNDGVFFSSEDEVFVDFNRFLIISNMVNEIMALDKITNEIKHLKTDADTPHFIFAMSGAILTFSQDERDEFTLQTMIPTGPDNDPVILFESIMTDDEKNKILDRVWYNNLDKIA